MIGSLTKDSFKPDENYDAFYHHHRFEPFPEPFDAHLVLPRADWTKDIIDDHNYNTLLDLCCLDGFVPLTIAKHCPTIRGVVGVDLSQEGIDLANKLYREAEGVKKAEFICMSVEDFLTELSTSLKFDAITMFEAVEHFKSTPDVIELAKKHLNPGGRILISTPSADHRYGIGNDDACHLRYYFNRPESKRGETVKEWEGRPIVSLVDEIEALGGTVDDNLILNDLIHLSATFD